MAAARVERGEFDANDGSSLCRRQLLRLALAGQRLAFGGRSALASPRRHAGRDERQRSGGGRAVVVGEPEREPDERSREPVDDAPRLGDVDAGGRLDVRLDDDAAKAPAAEPDRDDRPREASSGTS